MNNDQIAQLVDAHHEVTKEIEQKEQELKELKITLRSIEEEHLPAAMQELGIEKAQLENGTIVKMGLEVYASITEANAEKAYAWLDSNGFGGLIKFDISIPFSKNQSKEANALYTKLKKLGVNDATLKPSIHAQTLRAFLREQLSKSTEDSTRLNVPLQLFSANPIFKATVKEAKR